jgi:hypothetical protein
MNDAMCTNHVQKKVLRKPPNPANNIAVDETDHGLVWTMMSVPFEDAGD